MKLRARFYFLSITLLGCEGEGLSNNNNREGVMSYEVVAKLEETESRGAINMLPKWQNYTPANVRRGVSALVAEAEQSFSSLEDSYSPTWDGLVVPLTGLEYRVGKAMGTVSHLLSVKYSDDMKDAYDEVRGAYISLINRMNQSEKIYQGLLKIKDSEAFNSLGGARRRIVTESLRGMERAGVHLSVQAKQRFQEIQQRLSELSNNFSTNLVKQEQSLTIRVTDPNLVQGVPEAVLRQALEPDESRNDEERQSDFTMGPWEFVVNGPNYVAVMENAIDRGLREEFYRAYRTRGTDPDFDNMPIVGEILRLRQEQAALVGFDSYAEFSIDDKMAPSLEAVWALLQELEDAARPVAKKEYRKLVEFMRSKGADEASDPQPWDLGFWSERMREDLYDYDAEALREFFQLTNVFGGLFALIEKLYGVQILEVPDAQVSEWDPDVQFFEVIKDQQVIAAFYVDPYARPGEKRGGAWMNTVVDRGSLLVDGSITNNLPVALFVMNVRPPIAGQEGLLSLDEVRTLFHEFGHATQHMFTQIEDVGASGLNMVEWDAVELASQFNEFWMDHKPFLQALTAHVENGRQLDDETVDRIIASRNFMSGVSTLRQLQFGKTDLRLHEKVGFSEDAVGLSPFDVEQTIIEETLVTPFIKGESMLPAFGHLFSGGYAAGYYSYKWAEVLAADAFAAFREAGLEEDDRLKEVAGRFYDTVLGLGGSLPAGEVFRLFRGRDATPDALLKDQGLR